MCSFLLFHLVLIFPLNSLMSAQRFWHDFYNVIFKINHKLHIPSKWATCALNKKFWVRIWFRLSFINHSVHYHLVIQCSAAWFTIIVKLQINRNEMLLHPVLKRLSSVCISDISLNSILKYLLLATFKWSWTQKYKCGDRTEYKDSIYVFFNN